jgi:hypothetical protein
VNGVNNQAAEAESSADACSAIALSESLPLLQRDPVGRTCPMLFEFFDFFGEDVGSRFVLALYVPRFENAEIKKNQKLKTTAQSERLRPVNGLRGLRCAGLGCRA